MAGAIANAAMNAETAYGVPGYREMRERMGRAGR
jgi:hypothetical protein